MVLGVIKSVYKTSGAKLGIWRLCMNRASNIHESESELDIVLTTSYKKVLKQAIKFIYVTNNKAENETLIAYLN